MYDDIFTELVEYDSLIAGSIDELIKQKKIVAPNLHFSKPLEGKLLMLLSEALVSEDTECIRSYVKYLENIKELIKAAEERH